MSELLPAVLVALAWKVIQTARLVMSLSLHRQLLLVFIPALQLNIFFLKQELAAEAEVAQRPMFQAEQEQQYPQPLQHR
jgi:hypothetical protein